MSDYEDDWYDDDGDNYYYVEDSYGIADDLAEHAIASPAPYDLDEDDYWDDLSRFDYWCDIEYDSDAGYNDVDITARRTRAKTTCASRSNEDLKAPSKRKAADGISSRVSKRTRTAGNLQPVLEFRMPKPVVWRDTPLVRDNRKRVDLDAVKPVAIFKDWRERFAGVEGFPAMLKPTKFVPVGQGEVSGVCGADDAIGPSSTLLEKLPADKQQLLDALRQYLRQNLMSLGFDYDGIDESILLEFSLRFVQNPQEPDKILAELAQQLVGGELGEELGHFTNWVVSQAKERVGERQMEASCGAEKKLGGAVQRLLTRGESGEGVGGPVDRHGGGFLPRLVAALEKADDAEEAAADRDIEKLLQHMLAIRAGEQDEGNLSPEDAKTRSFMRSIMCDDEDEEGLTDEDLRMFMHRLLSEKGGENEEKAWEEDEEEGRSADVNIEKLMQDVLALRGDEGAEDEDYPADGDVGRLMQGLLGHREAEGDEGADRNVERLMQSLLGGDDEEDDEEDDEGEGRPADDNIGKLMQHLLEEDEGEEDGRTQSHSVSGKHKGKGKSRLSASKKPNPAAYNFGMLMQSLLRGDSGPGEGEEDIEDQDRSHLVLDKGKGKDREGSSKGWDRTDVNMKMLLQSLLAEKEDEGEEEQVQSQITSSKAKCRVNSIHTRDSTKVNIQSHMQSLLEDETESENEGQEHLPQASDETKKRSGFLHNQGPAGANIKRLMQSLLDDGDEADDEDEDHFLQRVSKVEHLEIELDGTEADGSATKVTPNLARLPNSKQEPESSQNQKRTEHHDSKRKAETQLSCSPRKTLKIRNRLSTPTS